MKSFMLTEIKGIGWSKQSSNHLLERSAGAAAQQDAVS